MACLSSPPPISTLECLFRSFRNGVRVDSQQLRDIQDLIAKLDDVNRQLALPVHAVPLAQVMEQETADAAS